MHGTTRARLARAGLSVLLGYVLALQLALVALAGSAQVARARDGTRASLAGPHLLCAPGSALDHATDPAGPAPAHDGTCCLLACHGGPSLVPPASAPVAQPRARVVPLSRPSTADLGARPATAPPGQGHGPRAPPSDLI